MIAKSLSDICDNIIVFINYIQVSFVNPRMEVMEKLMASKFVEKVGKESFFLSLDDAVAANQYELRKLKINGAPDE